MISLNRSNGGMSIWWTILVLHFAASHAIKCPQMCDCQWPTVRELQVYCGNRVQNESTFIDELQDLLLSDDKLRSLQIRNSSLTHVPESICNLSKLTSLRLDYNRITHLPDNCFRNMPSLNELSASHNFITELQDRLFDGLNSLERVTFDYNQITRIGLHVFSNKSDLVNLKHISVYSNYLQSLEPWPFIRGLHGSRNSKVQIDLRRNQISNFTNSFNLHFNCSSRSYASVFLCHNRIRHVKDIAIGMGLPWSTQLLCQLAVRDTHPSFDVVPGYQPYYICDCQDFMINTLLRRTYGQFRRVDHNGLVNLFVCSAPPRLAGKFMFQLPLTELECELSDRCPSSCQCVYRPANATLHVYCSAANLSSLPLELPPLPKSYDRYKLDFSNNKLLRLLEGRPYFVNTSILDVTNCAIDVVDINAWREVAKLQSLFVSPHVYLQNNKISSLPFEVTEINFTSVHLTLNNNPWQCSCEHYWMIDWFRSLSMYSNVGDVMCASPSRLEGRNIVVSSKDDFCIDPSIRMMKIALSSTLVPVAVLLIFGFSVYRLRVRLFTGWKFHPFDRDECVGEDMDYDVFLCCSSIDDNPHALRILGEMESKGYKVFYHERDFLPGELITDNIVRGIERSKRTVCLLSESFLRSNYCMTEFEAAYHHNVVVLHKKRLIVLMMLESPNVLNDIPTTAVLRQCLRQYTYIKYPSGDWLNKLLYALPLHGLLQHNRDHPNDDDVPLIQP